MQYLLDKYEKRLFLLTCCIPLILFFLLNSAHAATEITLEWDWDRPVEPGVVKYIVYYKAGTPGNSVKENYDGSGLQYNETAYAGNGELEITDPNIREITFTNLIDTEFYFFAVSAVSEGGLESDLSNEVSIVAITSLATDFFIGGVDKYAVSGTSAANSSVTLTAASAASADETITIGTGTSDAEGKWSIEADFVTVSNGRILITAQSEFGTSLGIEGDLKKDAIKGDVNEDNEITAQDAVDAFWLSFNATWSNKVLFYADFNEDDEITSQDAVDIFWASF